MSSLDDIPPVPKIEHSEEEDFDDSSPEAEDHHLTPEVAQVQKRKGGRKPIYATSEERKQRNRQAQAAFRERRTEYIKQLETTIKHHEEQLQTLQQSHRSAADECLMLRYKNSLLERILLEKGVDVQSELKVKTEASHILPHTAPGHTQPSPVQRAVMNRHGQPRRSGSSSAIKPIRPHAATSHPPPRLQPTPPSQSMSPASTTSPHMSGKTIPRSSSGDPKSQKQRQQQQIDQRHQHYQASSKIGMNAMQNHATSAAPGSSKSGEMGNASSSASFYPSPFQAHIEQLEQEEYDAQAEMLEEEDPSENSLGPGPYSQQYQQHSMAANQQMPLGMQGQPPMPGMPGMQSIGQPRVSQPVDPNNPAYGVVNAQFDPYDPSLDADPFGLTASMHFPTQFTYQENSMRR